MAKKFIKKKKEKERDYYVYSTKCECCNHIQPYCGSGKKHGWQKFYATLKMMMIWDFDFRWCDVCKKLTRTVLISFDDSDGT